MQFISDYGDSRRFLFDMAGCLRKEAFSWQDWYLLHIIPVGEGEPIPDAETQLSVAKLVRLLLPEGEGTIIAMPDGSLCVLLRHAGKLDLRDLITALNHDTDIRVPPLHLIASYIEHERLLAISLIESYTGVEQAEAAPRTSDEALLHELVPHLGNFLGAWTHLRQGRENRHAPHLLIVDDDPIARRIVRQSFCERYPVVTASSASEAIEKHLLLAPDIVFLDIGLPDCDGFRILDHIRACDPDCSVIMFSGNSFLENRMKALNSGANGFLAKPYNRSQFEHYIEDWQKEKRVASCG